MTSPSRSALHAAQMTSTDLFADLRAPRLAALQALLPDLPAELRPRAGRAAARPRPWRHGHQCRLVVGQGGAAAAARSRRRAGRAAGGAAGGRRGRAGRARLRQSAPARGLPARPAAGDPGGGRGLRRRTVGAGARVNVEYVSANPTGPMHVGHCRGAVVGDALANLLAKAGFDVTREYYINDAGAQVAGARLGRLLALPAGARHAADRGRTSPPTVPGGLQYRGDYLDPGRRGAGGARTATALASPDARHRRPRRLLARHRARLHRRRR